MLIDLNYHHQAEKATITLTQPTLAEQDDIIIRAENEKSFHVAVAH
jgi:hypothetical protein